MYSTINKGSKYPTRRSRGRLPHPLEHGEPAELPGLSPALQTPIQATWVLGGIGGRLGRSEDTGGRGPPRPQTRGAGEERKVFAPLTQAQEACWAPRWGPLPSEIRVGGMPGPLLFLEPKSHPPHPPGPIRALWVLSIGPTHHPNLVLA